MLPLLTGQLLAECLVLEARDLCFATCPLLGTRSQEMLQNRLVFKLASDEVQRRVDWLHFALARDIRQR